MKKLLTLSLVFLLISITLTVFQQILVMPKARLNTKFLVTLKTQTATEFLVAT